MSKHKKTGVWLLAFFSLLGLLGNRYQIPVMAAGMDDQVILSVAQTLDGDTAKLDDEAQTFSYQLKAKEAGNPLPEGSTGDACVFDLMNTQTVTLAAMTFDTVGEYHYELSLKEKKTDPAYSCDEQVYAITVYVSALNGGGVRADATAVVKSGLKTNELSFAHQYQGEETPPTTDGGERPSIGAGKNPSSGGTTIKPAAASIVKTGDTTNPALWLIIAAVALATAVVVLGLRKKKVKIV